MERTLQRLVREILARTPGGTEIRPRVETLSIALPLGAEGAPQGPVSLASNLISQVQTLVDAAVVRDLTIRPGRAHCHRCGVSECDHSRPPSCRHIFIGYGPTGVPRWGDFAQVCLDRRHPQVDELFIEPPALLTLLRSGEELQRELLGAFRRSGVVLLGQLGAGFFPVRSRAEEGRGVVALTIQVSAVVGPEGGPRLELNVLGLAPSGEALHTLWERERELAWRRPLRWARTVLAAIETQARQRRSMRGGRPDPVLERAIDGLLSGLARRLERERRARVRRTEHAEERHDAGTRPTRQALEDARLAEAQSLLFDERRATWVVLGERGRTHFFSAEGRLVSSVRYSREAIVRKLGTQVWRRATPKEIEALRDQLSET